MRAERHRVGGEERSNSSTADPERLDEATSLDELGARQPLLRAMVVADALRQRSLPSDLIDASATVGELRSWVAAIAHGSADDAPRSQWPLRTPRAVLRPIAPLDLGAIHAAFNDPATSWRLPSRGRTVLPSAVERVLDGADLQLIGALHARPEVPVTLQALNRFDPVNGTADLTVVGLTRTEAERSIVRPPRGIRFETVAMFVSHAFRSLDLCKITASIPAFNWPYFADGAQVYFEVEGRLRRQIELRGDRHDVYQIAIFREAWEAIDETLDRA